MGDQGDALGREEAGPPPGAGTEGQGRRRRRGRQHEGRPQRWSLDAYSDIEAVREARKNNKPVPAKLADVATKWDDFNAKDRDYKKAVALSKEALEKEKRSVARSVGDVENIESLQGEVTEKQVKLDLTIGGQVQPYVMTLRKYEMKREGGPRVQSRWVVQNLQPAT